MITIEQIERAIMEAQCLIIEGREALARGEARRAFATLCAGRDALKEVCAAMLRAEKRRADRERMAARKV